MRRLGLMCLFLPVCLPAQTVGGRVHTIAAVCARPDTLVSGTGCGTGGTLRTVGDKGTVLRGPAGGSTPFGLSWYVHYDVAPDGWSTAKYLAPDSTPPVPGPVAVVRIDGFTQGWLTLLLGTTHQFTAVATDASGRVVATSFTWRASAPAIASVEVTGVVTARSAGLGQDTVTATAPNGVRAWFLVSVPFTLPVTPVTCGIAVPPPVGCGMREGTWALLGIDTVSRSYGPWFMDDTLGRKHKTVRVTVSDTTP